MRQAVAISALIAAAVLQSCAPIVDLEDENYMLMDRVDSLNTALDDCRGENDRVQQRLASIEAQNLQLDDRNRELTANQTELRAQIAALQSASASHVPQQSASRQPPVPPVSQQQYASQQTSRTPPTTSVVPSALNAGNTTVFGTKTPDFDPHNDPDMEYLARYQSALSAFNAGHYQDSFAGFHNLIKSSQANSMTDNCVYWMAENAVHLGRQHEAVALYSIVLTYSASEKIDDALFGRGNAYLKSGDGVNARKDFERLLSMYGRSPYALETRKLLAGMR